MERQHGEDRAELEAKRAENEKAAGVKISKLQAEIDELHHQLDRSRSELLSHMQGEQMAQFDHAREEALSDQMA